MGLYFLLLSSLVLGTSALWPHQYTKPYHSFISAFHAIKSAPTVTLPCVICGIAVNEVEALLADNMTQSAIEQFINSTVCSHLSGIGRSVCDSIVVEGVPLIIETLEKEEDVNTVCVGMQFCKTPLPSNHSDPIPLSTVTLDLDDPPEQRWTTLCNNASAISFWNGVVSVLKQVLSLGHGNGTEVLKLGHALNARMQPDYGAEVRSCAAGLGLDYGWVTLFQLGYEVSDACTSIVAETADGQVYHARNLDFGAGMAFTDGLKSVAMIVNATQNGQLLFQYVTFGGFVGVLSGMRPGGVSITIDTRFQPLLSLFEEVVLGMLQRNLSLVTFVARQVLEQQLDYQGALNMLSNTPLVCSVYYIVAGAGKSEGAVISRNRTSAVDIWTLGSSPSGVGSWFLLETNYDHWRPAPWFDDRRDPGIQHMEEMGQNVTSMEDGLWKVLSTKPTLNLETTISYIACPKTGLLSSLVRWCPYPCQQ